MAIIIARSRRCTEEAIKKLGEEARTRVMQINHDKTECMKTDRSRKANIDKELGTGQQKFKRICVFKRSCQILNI